MPTQVVSYFELGNRRTFRAKEIVRWPQQFKAFFKALTQSLTSTMPTESTLHFSIQTEIYNITVNYHDIY